MGEHPDQDVSFPPPPSSHNSETNNLASGNSTAHEAIVATPSPTIADKWNALPSGAKIAVYASGAAVGAIAIFAAAFFCIRQRRRGARQAKFAELKADEERRELDAFRRAGVNPDSFREEATEYDAKEMMREGVTRGNSYSIPSSPVGHPASAAAIGAGATVGGAGAGAMGGARSPMPLLRDGQTSPVLNNGPYSDRAMHNASPLSMRSPAPPGNPGMGHQQRSFTNPNPAYGAQRMGSPGPMGAPHPQRSFTNGGYAAPPSSGPYGQEHDQSYWGGNNYR